MRYRHITIGLIALSLIAITFVGTVTAVEIHPTMTAEKRGKDITFTILTDTSEVTFSASDVNPDTISITVYDMKGNPLPSITPDPINIELNDYTIIIHIVKQDGVPAHVSSVAITGSIITGPYSGYTFRASCPGWAFGNVH